MGVLWKCNLISWGATSELSALSHLLLIATADPGANLQSSSDSQLFIQQYIDNPYLDHSQTEYQHSAQCAQPSVPPLWHLLPSSAPFKLVRSFGR